MLASFSSSTRAGDVDHRRDAGVRERAGRGLADDAVEAPRHGASCLYDAVTRAAVARPQIAPTLCGSSMPSSTTIRASPERRRPADAPAPRSNTRGRLDSRRPRPGGRRHARRAIERLRVDPLDGDPLLRAQRDDLVHARSARALIRSRVTPPPSAPRATGLMP
jgi:hypothetical protein